MWKNQNQKDDYLYHNGSEIMVMVVDSKMIGVGIGIVTKIDGI